MIDKGSKYQIIIGVIGLILTILGVLAGLYQNEIKELIAGIGVVATPTIYVEEQQSPTPEPDTGLSTTYKAPVRIQSTPPPTVSTAIPVPLGSDEMIQKEADIAASTLSAAKNATAQAMGN